MSSSPYDSLQDFRASWIVDLRARNVSGRTIDSYLLAFDQLVDFLKANDMPATISEVRRQHVAAFLAYVQETRAPATARQRYASLNQFFRWLEDEDEIDTNPMTKLKPPRVPVQPPPVLSEDQLTAILNTATGTGFEARRDAALLHLFADTGARLAEIANLTPQDINLDTKTLVVLGKGHRFRSVPFGNETAKVVDRYLRGRRNHRLNADPHLWLGRRGPLSPSGIAQVIKRRGRQVGLNDLHAHLFRYSFAHRWLAAGGQEGDLTRIAGWSDRQMLDRYGASAASERAIEAHGQFGVVDRL